MMSRDSAHPVVVGIDGSSAAIEAARWAVDEAISRTVPLRLIHVIPVDNRSTPSVKHDRLTAQYAEAALHSACAAVQSGSRPVDVHTVVHRGDIGLTLAEESGRAAMICVGSVGIGRVASRLLGSAAVGLAQHAHCPVAIIHPDGESSRRKRIVAVVDRHPDSDEVLHHAFDEARLRRVSLLALGVRRWKVGAMSEPELVRRLSNWTPHYSDVAVQKCITDTATEYLVTRNEHIQLLVTGSADANKLTRLVGPHGHAFATYPNCSVLLVRPC